jgi:hypothetical protein
MSDTVLQRRFDEVCAEIRAYPTPIARCDEQLTQLLEERAILLSRLQYLQEQPTCTPETRWTNDGGLNAA